MTAPPEPPDLPPFGKRYPSVALAETALRRSIAARAAGVATPAVLRRGGHDTLLFERIDAGTSPSLAWMIRAVQGLERMPADGLNRFDPFLRITPRLTAAPPHIRQFASALADRDATLGWPAATVIHGDFHPGQCLQDRAATVWLVDLDDLALGPPEADLGNLAAWIATRREGPLDRQARSALSTLQAHAPQADLVLLDHFCRVALLRRALKLAEKGQPWALQQMPSST